MTIGLALLLIEQQGLVSQRSHERVWVRPGRQASRDECPQNNLRGTRQSFLGESPLDWVWNAVFCGPSPPTKLRTPQYSRKEGWNGTLDLKHLRKTDQTEHQVLHSRSLGDR